MALALLNSTATVPRSMHTLILPDDYFIPLPLPSNLQHNTHPSVLVDALEPYFTEKIEATKRESCHPPVTRPPAPQAQPASVPVFPAFPPVTEDEWSSLPSESGPSSSALASIPLNHSTLNPLSPCNGHVSLSSLTAPSFLDHCHLFTDGLYQSHLIFHPSPLADW